MQFQTHAGYVENALNIASSENLPLHAILVNTVPFLVTMHIILFLRYEMFKVMNVQACEAVTIQNSRLSIILTSEYMVSNGSKTCDSVIIHITVIDIFRGTKFF